MPAIPSRRAARHGNLPASELPEAERESVLVQFRAKWLEANADLLPSSRVDDEPKPGQPAMRPVHVQGEALWIKRSLAQPGADWDRPGAVAAAGDV